MKVDVYPALGRMVLEFDNGQKVEVRGDEAVERVFEQVDEARIEWEAGLFALDVSTDGFHE
jgi:hypothetical protein